MGGACSINGGKRDLYRLLLGKPEGRRLLGRPRCRWIKEIGFWTYPSSGFSIN
jgi:hypothetical protein